MKEHFKNAAALYAITLRAFGLMLCVGGLSTAAAPASPGADVAPMINLISSMQPGEWRQIPNTKMSTVFPPLANHPAWGVSGPHDVIFAWGGGAFDSKRNVMIFNGGGHGGYGGNEVYAFWLDSLKWERLTDPSPLVRNDVLNSRGTTTEVWSTVGDIAPISTHTYGSLIYLPNVDRIMRSGGSDYKVGWSFDDRVWLFDIDTRRWQARARGLGGYRYAAFDPITGKVVSITSQSLKTYDPITDSIKEYPLARATSLTYAAALDPVNRWLVVKDRSYDPTKGVYGYKINVDGSVSGPNPIATSGATHFNFARGWDYDTKRKRIVGWDGGPETGYLDTVTWTWSRFRNEHSPYKPSAATFYSGGAIKSGSIAISDTPHYSDFFGRWRYVPKYDVFVAYNNPHRDVLIWKPQPVEAGDSTPPPPAQKARITPILQSLQDGQTVQLPPGVYEEAAVVSASNVVIKARGVKLENTSAEDKAALVIKGNNVTIEELECSGIRVEDGNGACVRLEGKELTLRKVWFHDSQSGVLSWNRDSGTVLIEDSRFERLGRAHGVYIGRGSTNLVVRNNRFLSSMAEGHEIKSRAARTTIERNVIASLDGIDSRLIDLPEGGEIVIRRNVLQKGRSSSNQQLIGIGLEGQRFLHSRNSTVIEENTIVMDRDGSNVLVHYRYVPPPRLEGNRVVGGKPLGGNNTWFRDRAAAGLGKYPSLPGVQ